MNQYPRLFDLLPALYRQRDADPARAGQFEAYIGLMDEVFKAVDADIETLYHDHFIETCADWMVPYIGDLLGVTHLKGAPRTLRADVARTVSLRSRAGTLGALESLAFNLTSWAAHAVEMRERLVWNQHLNHLRPDRGVQTSHSPPRHIAEPVRHGTVTLRDPGVLSFLGGAFDGFARTVDLKPTGAIHPRPNLPNLVLFLWRLRDFLVPVTRPAHISTLPQPGAAGSDAAFAARFVIDPFARQTRLFNTFRYNPGAEPPEFSQPDRTPGPMPTARLQDGPPTGNVTEYAAVDIFTGSRPDDPGDGAPGLTVHLPATVFAGTNWFFRGANLCAWEDGLRTPLQEREIVIDPVHGRLLFGITDDANEGAALRNSLRTSYTYAAPGPTGAHPIPREFPETIWPGLEPPEVMSITAQSGSPGLRAALSGLASAGPPRIIEITDSMTHRLNFNQIDDIVDEDGPTLTLARPFWIRAASGQRPVIEFRQALRMRASDPENDALNRALDIRFDGVFITRRNAPAATAIVTRAAVNQLIFTGTTLDPAGHMVLDGSVQGSRADMQHALELSEDLGFSDPVQLAAFGQLPEIKFIRSIAGPVAMAGDYQLALNDSLVDGGAGPSAPAPGLAISALNDPETAYGPRLSVDGATILGRSRVRTADGEGAIFVHTLQVRDHQSGCLSFCWFSSNGNRLPQYFACLFANTAALSFTASVFGAPGYGQLNRIRTDPRILQDGPGADEMGAFGYQFNTHKWKNLNIRLREFTPVGVRPILATIT